MTAAAEHPDVIRAEVGAWSIEYHQGARLADIYHAETRAAVECIEVGDFDWNPPGGGSGRQSRQVTATELEQELGEWVEEQGDCYMANEIVWRHE